jgi:hypothetical protein
MVDPLHRAMHLPHVDALRNEVPSQPWWGSSVVNTGAPSVMIMNRKSTGDRTEVMGRSTSLMLSPSGEAFGEQHEGSSCIGWWNPRLHVVRGH